MADDGKAIMREIFARVWNEGDLDAVDRLFALGFVDHELTVPFPMRGIEGYKRYVEFYRHSFPDGVFTVEQQLAEGDLVTTRWTVRGTHKEELLGIPPTGKRLTVGGITITRIRDGKVQEGWTYWDNLGLPITPR